jgi:hypothetical protein
MDLFSRYEWPGNIRELQNVVKYISNVVEPGNTAMLEDLPPYLFRKFTGTIKSASFTGDHIGRVPGSHMGIADPSREAGTTFLPGAYDRPEVHRVLIIMLFAMKQYASAFKGVGYTALLKRIREKFPTISEYYIKKLLQMLRDFGYAEAGKTKQGTAITAKGEELLARLSVMYDGGFTGVK